MAGTSAPILVVDDEELIVMALGEILRQAGYEVVTASQPLVALEQLKKKEFSVIISDQRMPGISGSELLAEARRQQPNATRILVTGVLNLDTVIEAINQGEIFRFMVKPWLREEFLATVSNAVQRYELLCQNSRLQAATQTINEQLTQANRALEEKISTVAQQNQQLADINQLLETSSARSSEWSVRVLESFCPAIGAQTRCTRQVCQAVAGVANLSESERRVLEGAACLYDVGFVGLPRDLIGRWLAGPENLDPQDQEKIRQHPVFSQDLANFASGDQQVGEIVRAHHERFDGTGYPDGLRGDKIPWLARLLAVAVSYSSSHSAPVQALDSLKFGAGSRFDPEAIRILQQAIPAAGLPSKERQVSLKDLAPGMILARAIYTHNGLLLVPEGQRLSAAFIEELVAHNRVHPLAQSLMVYC